ncbi:MAG: response regulator [Lachnospiraceae bacterium]|nr:response regulator [Lachnospiraceae bacterium]
MIREQAKSKRVGLITYQFSVVVKSIEKGLKDQKFEVTMLEDKIEEINSVIDGIDAFVIYFPDSVFDDMDRVKRLFLICDTFKDKRRIPILIGAETNRDAYVKTVPALKDYPWINRPVDMYKLAYEVNKEEKRLVALQSQKRILIIDDDPFYAQMVCEWLKSDYQMEMVADGMQGITFLTNNQVDLILLDYEMPVVDGPKILEMLRMHPNTSSIPVIFLTGIGTKESIARVMGLKPQGYILKSTTREDLLKNLNAFFEKQFYK